MLISYRSATVIFTGVCVVLLLSQCGVPDSSISSPATPVSTSVIAPLEVVTGISTLPTLSGPEQDETKIAMFQTSLPAYPPPTADPLFYPPPTTNEPLPTSVYIPGFEIGISQDCEHALQEFIRLENCWSGEINEEYVFVFAGSTREDNNQGALCYYTSSLTGGSSTKYKCVYTAIGEGALKIITDNGNSLELLSRTGNTYIFDVALGALEGVEVPVSTPVFTTIPVPTTQEPLQP